MVKRTVCTVWGWLALFTLTACSLPTQPAPPVNKLSTTQVVHESNLVMIGYTTVDHLLKNLKQELSRDKTILVASLVNVESLEQSSNFGRIMAEFISSRLSQRGYSVTELKFRNSVFIKKGGGEFLLSRELEAISSAHDAEAVVVGTYTGTKHELYVSTRIVNAKTGMIVSSFDYQLPLDQRLRRLLSTAP